MKIIFKTLAITYALTVSLIATKSIIAEAEQKPETAIVLGGGVISNIVDGDTIDVEFTRNVRVRFLDCWAPENKNMRKHPSEKKLGLEAEAYLRSIAPEGTKITLRVATDGDNDIGDGLTFGRVVGDVWADDRPTESLNYRMNQSGKTFATKKQLESHLTSKDLGL